MSSPKTFATSPSSRPMGGTLNGQLPLPLVLDPAICHPNAARVVVVCGRYSMYCHILLCGVSYIVHVYWCVLRPTSPLEEKSEYFWQGHHEHNNHFQTSKPHNIQSLCRLRTPSCIPSSSQFSVKWKYQHFHPITKQIKNNHGPNEASLEWLVDFFEFL